MAHRPMIFDKEYAMIQLNDMKKQGYCSIKAMPAWLRNEYRELTLDKAIEVVNDWIDEYKIKHEHLVSLTTTRQTFVVTEKEYNDYMTLYKMMTQRRKHQ